MTSQWIMRNAFSVGEPLTVGLLKQSLGFVIVELEFVHPGLVGPTDPDGVNLS